MKRECSLISGITGMSALFAGVLFYVYFRDPHEVYFLRFFDVPAGVSVVLPPFLTGLGGHLPSFLHVFSFSLLTAAFLPLTRKAIFFSCTFWTVVNLCFELGQKYKTAAARIVPSWFQGIPFLENTADFFRFGSFDVIDMTAMTAGGVAAGLFLSLMLQRRLDHEKRNT